MLFTGWGRDGRVMNDLKDDLRIILLGCSAAPAIPTGAVREPMLVVLRAVGDYYCGYEVGEKAVTEAEAGNQDRGEADQGWVEVEVFGNSSADAADHAAVS